MANESIQVNPHGQIFIGPARTAVEAALLVKDGAKAPVTVEIAFFAAKNEKDLHDALMIVRGQAAFDAGIDGRTLRYQAVPAGTGCDFRFFSQGGERTRLSTRDTWGGWNLVQVHLNGSSIPLFLHPNAGAEARPLHLVTAYEQENAEAPSRLALGRQAGEISEALAAKGSKAKLSLEWNGREQDPSTRRAMQLLLTAFAPALEKLSADPLGKEALAPVEEYVLAACTGGTLSAAKTGAQLRIDVGNLLGDDPASTGAAASDWLVQALEKAL